MVIFYSKETSVGFLSQNEYNRTLHCLLISSVDWSKSYLHSWYRSSHYGKIASKFVRRGLPVFNIVLPWIVTRYDVKQCKSYLAKNGDLKTDWSKFVLQFWYKSYWGHSNPLGFNTSCYAQSNHILQILETEFYNYCF